MKKVKTCKHVWSDITPTISKPKQMYYYHCTRCGLRHQFFGVIL